MMKTLITQTASMVLGACLFAACNTDEDIAGDQHHEKTHDENTVALTMQQMKAIELKVGRMEKHNLSTTVKSNGRTELPPQNKANVSALISGAVKDIFVIEGDMVKKGQVLATLEHPGIVDMQQIYLENISKLGFLEQDYLRKKKLFEEQVVSGKEFQKALADFNTAKSTAEGLKTKLQMLGININTLEQGKISPSINIISPISGYVRFAEVNIGSFVEPDNDMFEIVDNSNIHADLLVYEKDIPKIKTGQEVHFTFSNIPGKELKGRIFSVGRAYENEARAITVHAYIENPKGDIIPGMYVNAHIMVDSISTDALPEEALANEGDKFFIFIKTEGVQHPGAETGEQDHKHAAEEEEERWFFKKTEVIPGVRANGFVQIKQLTPIPPDAQIVVNAAYYLLAETGKGETEHSH